MKSWEQTLLGPDEALEVALKSINASGRGICLVVDGGRRLLGTLSDGDVRRAIIAGATLQTPCHEVMNARPTGIAVGASRRAILAELRDRQLRHLPILDDGVVVGLAMPSDFLSAPERPNRIVIMAGGKGERLAPLTLDTPKPMLKVGPRPVLETIVRTFAEQGFRSFFLSINYRADQIESHFGDGSDFGIEIDYLRETRPLGTCGALSLMPRPGDGPFILANGDVLMHIDYYALIEAHEASGADLTVVVREHRIQVPFGVIESGDNVVLSITEKPTFAYPVNAGLYVLSESALDLIPEDQPMDMPQLLTQMLARGLKVCCQRDDGYWIDIGRMSDYDRANAEFGDVFSTGA
ncbi:MAG: nucleotidyltransferase family protein [Pseudomonadota bacterium]|nr:nucleotidyltransferase family protein [Pseudomonadota bacterium]